MALRLFSRLPTGPMAHERPALDRIAPVLPLASVLITLGPAVVLVGGSLAGLPSYFAATLAVAAAVAVSGGMGEDSLADAADGLFGGSSPERRLEIMKDSRHGTYGVAAIVLLLMLRVSAIGTVAAVDAMAAGMLWLAAGVAGRSASLWLAVALLPARAEGLSAQAGQLGWGRFAMGAALAGLLVVSLGWMVSGPLPIASALALSVAIVAGWTALCRRLVGGQTGDLIGALGALVEVGVLTGLLIG